MTSKFLIYGLMDPRTGHLRYVGKSESGLTRPKEHCQPSRLKQDRKTHKGNWIRKLHGLGLMYKVVIIEEYPDAECLSEREIFWIAYYLKMGCDLTNGTKGGEGVLGHRHSALSKVKMSVAHTGYRHTPEAIAKMSKAQKGKIMSPVARVKISVAARKRFEDPEERAKVSAVHKWKVATLAQVLNNSTSHGGRPFKDETEHVWNTQHEAARALGLHQGNIGKCLKGKQNQTGGHTFTYLDPK